MPTETTATETIETREGWLHALARELAPTFAELGHELPPLRIGVGFTSKGMRSNRIGECWSTECAEDGCAQIIVTTTLHKAEDVAAIVAHELVHAAVGIKAQHGPAFRKVAVALGLTGPMTATVAGPKFLELIAPMVERIGAYPHTATNFGQGQGSGPKKQATRMIKVECSDCGYTVRTSRKWLDVAIPCCPACDVEMVPER